MRKLPTIAGCLLTAAVALGIVGSSAGILSFATLFSGRPAATQDQCISEAGKLPVSVPEPLNGIITTASTLYNTDPIAVAVVFSIENNVMDREPPEPYGNGQAWPVSPPPANAKGPFQFVDDTWKFYQNANPAQRAGPTDVNDLTDATFAAAQYLSDLGATAGAPLGSPLNVQSEPTSVLNAMAMYHSGNFDSLGRFGREYVEMGYERYVALAGLNNGPPGSILSSTPPAQAGGIGGCSFGPVPNDLGERYANTDNLTCTAGTDIGVVQTSKGNLIRLCKVGTATVNASIASNVAALFAAAEGTGLDLAAGSSFRSPESQIAVRRANCGTSYYAIYEMPSGDCSPRTALPGTSEHEQGRAIDFTSKGVTIRSYNSAAHRWLAANAPSFGLLPLKSRDEAWHFSVSGG